MSDETESITSAQNPELARQMENIRQRAEQADALAKRAIDLVSEKDERIETLEAENDQLRERLTTLESRTPDPALKDYADKTRDDKVREVRVSCCRKAQQNGDKAAIDYNDVLTLFDHRASVGHAYTLLKLAANLAGFSYDQRDTENDRLCVDLNTVSDEAVLSRVNKRENGGGR